jgi:hypothetical protein
MFASLKTSIAASVAALTVGFALSASPADAHGIRMGGFGGFHGGFHGGFRGVGFHRGWHRYGWGPAVGVGFVGTSCIVYQPIYDDAGNYLGSNAVNVCQ